MVVTMWWAPPSYSDGAYATMTVRTACGTGTFARSDLSSDDEKHVFIGAADLPITRRCWAIDLTVYEDDEHVLVQVGTARAPDCDDEMPETCRPQLDGSTPRAGQPMVFDPVGPSASVSISGGFLRGEVGDLDLPLAVVHTAAEYAERTITIRDTMIDVEFGPEELRGSLGGALLIEDLVGFAVMVDPSAPADEIRGAYSSFADLLQSASNPLECRALSIGMRLEAVHVGGT